jgi:CspA family cold shock protein
MHYRQNRRGARRDEQDFGFGAERAYDGGRGGFGGGPAVGGLREGGYGGFASTQPVVRRPEPIADRTGVRATIKWFSAEKGFGFATADDGSDVFVHGSVVRQSGREELSQGDVIVVDVARSDRGEKAVALHSVEEAPPSAARPPQRRAVPCQPDAAVGSIRGVVKWYNAEKGFGFVSPDDGSRDVFVHVTALGRSGLQAVAQGDRVEAEVVIGRKGPEIGSIRLA